MKIIIDNKIPYIKEAVQTIADEIISVSYTHLTLPTNSLV